MIRKDRRWKKPRNGRQPIPVSDPSSCGCGKNSYRTKGDAERMARLSSDRNMGALHAYHCPSGLGGWHIGHVGSRR